MRATRTLEALKTEDAEEMTSITAPSLQSGHRSLLDTTEVSISTPRKRDGVQSGSVSGDSDRNLYSEDESEDSDHIFAKQSIPGLPELHRNPPGSKKGQKSSTLDAKEMVPSSGGSSSSKPASSLMSSNRTSFSISSEINQFWVTLLYGCKSIEEDRLPWMTDFADRSKIRLPRKPRDVVGRLNLNIPYYYANYRELFYLITMPFLLVYNVPFFFAIFLTVTTINYIGLQKKRLHAYGDGVVVMGRKIRYRMLVHLLLITMATLFIFFNGLRTLMWVLLLNTCIVIPHALMRKPTYFDDEDLEKCRPKLVQYAICLVVLVFAYLEGDPCSDEAAENRRAAQRERKRMAQLVTRDEAKDSN